MSAEEKQQPLLFLADAQDHRAAAASAARRRIRIVRIHSCTAATTAKAIHTITARSATIQSAIFTRSGVSTAVSATAFATCTGLALSSIAEAALATATAAAIIQSRYETHAANTTSAGIAGRSCSRVAVTADTAGATAATAPAFVRPLIRGATAVKALTRPNRLAATDILVRLSR